MSQPPHPPQHPRGVSPGTTRQLPLAPPPPSSGPSTHELPLPSRNQQAAASGSPSGSPSSGAAVGGPPATPPAPGLPPVHPVPHATGTAQAVPPAAPGDRPAGGRVSPSSPTVRRRRGARQRAALVGLLLVALSLVLLQVGLALPFGSERYWSTLSLWSGFATLATVLGLAAFIGAGPGASRVRPAATWRIAAAGLTGLAVFWILVVLPRVDSDRGFVLTAALACLGAALWVAPARTR